MARIGSRLAGKLLESGRLPRSWHPVTSATPAASGPVQTSVTGGPKLAFQVVQGVEKVGEDEEFAWPGATFGGFGDAEEACLCPASSSQAGFCMLKTSASDPEIRAIRVHVQADSSSSPVPLASLPRIPPDVPNRCNLRPLTPKKPEKALYGVSPQRCCIPYMVCRGLSRFRFPKRTCYYFKRIEARGVWEPCGRNWRLSTYCGDVSKARSM